MTAILKKYEHILFFIIFAVLILFAQSLYDGKSLFAGDDLRYISYATSLYEHNIFGFYDAAQPGNANTPLYPALIASIMKLDQNFADSMLCFIHEGIASDCPRDFQSFFLLQGGLALLGLFLIYLLTLRICESRAAGWLAAALVLASGIPAEFSSIFMTGILILPFFFTLMLLCLDIYKGTGNQYARFLATGIVLAILTLIRPSYLYLFYGFILFFMSVAGLKRSKTNFLRLGILIAAFAVTVMPWALRNKAHFDSYKLTGGNYAEAILIERTNYNQMNWPEVGVAFIYWLPDFGDSLAKKIFPEKYHQGLGWGPDSYYGQGYRNKLENLTEELGSRDKILPYLVKEEILSPKHIAVSIPLALRGLYIAKYWGLVGLIAFTALLIQTLRIKDYALAIIALPVFFMVAFHAGLSVSIPRYNLPLIALYGLSMGFYIHLYGEKLVRKICKK